MTTKTAPATTTATTTTSTAVDNLLAAIEAGPAGDFATVFSGDAVLDATVPDWRFTRRGAGAARQFEAWFAHPGRYEELRRLTTADGEVVVYVLTWEEQGVPHAVHQCHVLTLDPASGLVTRDEFFCGGRWNATALAAMAEAADAETVDVGADHAR